MAYDPVVHKVILFGGAGSNNVGLKDTWTFANGTWTKLALNHSPSGRAGAKLVYDTARHQLVLFGGTSNYACGCRVNGNEWVFGNGKWFKISSTSVPTSTFYTFGMAYDPHLRGAVAFGGWNPGTGNTNVTWVLSHGNWSSPITPSNLTARQGSAMSYDPAINASVLYGGIDYPAFSDTWMYSRSGWIRAPVTGPGPVAWGMMAYDPQLHGVVLYGGWDGSKLLDSTWLLR